MKKTLTEQDIRDNPLLADCAVGDMLIVEHVGDLPVAPPQEHPKDPPVHP